MVVRLGTPRVRPRRTGLTPPRTAHRQRSCAGSQAAAHLGAETARLRGRRRRVSTRGMAGPKQPRSHLHHFFWTALHLPLGGQAPRQPWTVQARAGSAASCRSTPLPCPPGRAGATPVLLIKRESGLDWTSPRSSDLGLTVREGGVEPPRPFGHTDLNRARLPIPPPARRPRRVGRDRTTASKPAHGEGKG